jgi:hypothetical protein
MQNFVNCILSRVGLCDYRRGMDWWMDLLTTCIHHSVTANLYALQISRAPAKSSQSTFTSRCLVAVAVPLIPCSSPVQNSSVNCTGLSKSKLCYDRRSAGQSILEQSTRLGLTTRSWLLSDSCGVVDLGCPLWREDGSAVCNCYWSSPAQSFSGPSPLGLVAIFYSLGFETSLFVASYDSQGHGGVFDPASTRVNHPVLDCPNSLLYIRSVRTA